jgi:hypothetical protein
VAQGWVRLEQQQQQQQDEQQVEQQDEQQAAPQVQQIQERAKEQHEQQVRQKQQEQQEHQEHQSGAAGSAGVARVQEEQKGLQEQERRRRSERKRAAGVFFSPLGSYCSPLLFSPFSSAPPPFPLLTGSTRRLTAPWDPKCRSGLGWIPLFGCEMRGTSCAITQAKSGGVDC